jgi:O-antigen/teichoic acid export membrane protein
MVVTAAGFPLALARARDGGPSAGQEQLARNGLLLAAVLVPSAAGLWMIAGALVPIFVGAQFQEVTAAILPASILAGAARNFRIHCGEQVFLLHERPVVPLINDAVDAAAAVLLGGFGLWYAGLPGLVAGAAFGSVVSLAVTMIWAWWDHGFAIPGADAARITAATLLMMGALSALPEARSPLALGIAVAIGAVVFAAAMALLYPAERRKAMAVAGGLLQRSNA